MLTDIYIKTFTTNELEERSGKTYLKTTLHTRELYEFLYEQEHPLWILNQVKQYHSGNTASFRTFLLGLHTGETLRETLYGDNASLEGCQQQAQPLLIKLAKDILLRHETEMEQFEEFIEDSAIQQMDALKSQLEIDGYVYRNKNLYYSESSVIDEQQEQSYLESLVDNLFLTDRDVIKHHLKLSEDHYIESKWDDSIANSRKVLDAILTQIASAVYSKVNSKPIPPEMIKNATDIRNFLERQNIVTKVEREALDKNYGALSATGGHPYIAEKDQARLMRHLALTFSQFVLLRYLGFLANNL